MGWLIDISRTSRTEPGRETEITTPLYLLDFCQNAKNTHWGKDSQKINDGETEYPHVEGENQMCLSPVVQKTTLND